MNSGRGLDSSYEKEVVEEFRPTHNVTDHTATRLAKHSQRKGLSRAGSARPTKEAGLPVRKSVVKGRLNDEQDASLNLPLSSLVGQNMRVIRCGRCL